MAVVSVVVAARNAQDTIGRTLAALRAQDLRPEWEVVVVDDGSTDATARIVAEVADADPRFRLVSQPAAGPAHARNRGVVEAQGELLAFTDADCFPVTGWLTAAVAAAQGADLVQGAVCPEPVGQAGPFDRTVWVDSEVGLYETANLLVTRPAFERAGGFEEWLRPRRGKAMAEDVWLGWRVKRNGCRTVFCPQAQVHHAVFERTARGYVEERLRLEHFPAIVARIPELRDTLCWRRLFLSRRTAAFDAAAVAVAAAAARRSRWPLVAALPYAAMSTRRAARFRSSAPRAMAVDLVADAVGLASLVRGSLSSRSVLL